MGVLVFSLARVAVSATLHAADPISLEWDLRIRYEQVADDALANSADATTLRLRLSLRGDFGHGCSALLEGEGIASAGDAYNSGGDGRHALQTPLATLHAFNGWADKFLVTPARGLDDVYISANGKAGKFAWVAAYHDYRADTASAAIDHYGRELDLSLSRPMWKDWTGMVNVADYRADDFARDTRKVWVQVEYKGKWVR